MPAFRTVRHVPYPAPAMLALVADVASYPQFIPLCENLKVLSSARQADGSNLVIARMQVGYGPIHESFTSRVAIFADQRKIDVTYLDGPFRSMHNQWVFTPNGDGCDVEFHIAYEFRTLPLQLLLGAMFDRAFRKFSAAFEARARQIYGPPSQNTAAATRASDDMGPQTSTPSLAH